MGEDFFTTEITECTERYIRNFSVCSVVNGFKLLTKLITPELLIGSITMVILHQILFCTSKGVTNHDKCLNGRNQ